MAEMKLLTPYKVKSREFVRLPGYIYSLITYENGLVIRMDQTAQHIKVSANKPMVVHPDQSVSFIV
jgi:hypothetical protein